MGDAETDSTNPHYKSRYASLAAVRRACLPHLNANGIAVVQVPVSEGDRVGVRTVLIHESGESMGGTLTMTPRKNWPQEVGSVLAYARRYSLAAMAGIAQDDSDGEPAGDQETEPESAERVRPADTSTYQQKIPADLAPMVKELRTYMVQANPEHEKYTDWNVFCTLLEMSKAQGVPCDADFISTRCLKIAAELDERDKKAKADA